MFIDHKDDHYFDRFLRDGIKDAETGTPSGLWEKIEQKQDKAYQAKVFNNRLIRALSVMGVAMLAGLTLLIFSNDKAANKKETIKHNTQIIADNDVDNLNNNIFIHTNLNNQNTKSPVSKKRNTSIPETPKDINTKPVLQNNALTIKTNTNNNSTTNLLRNNSHNNIHSPTFNHSKTSNNIQPSIFTPAKSLKNILSPQTNHAQISNAVHASSINPVKRPDIIPNSPLSDVAPFIIHKMEVNNIKEHYNSNHILQTDFRPKDKCIRFTKPNFWKGISLDAVFAPEYYNRTLTPINEEYDLYRDRRNGTEKYEFGYMTGLRASLSLNNGVALRTGLLYSQIQEVFSYENEEERYSVALTIVDTLYDNQGNMNVVFDTIDVIEKGIRTVKTYNKHRFLGIPILASYEIELMHWQLNVNAGVLMNIFMRSRGQIMSPRNNVPEDVKDIRAFNRNTGYSLYTSIACNYKLTSRMSILIEPHFKYILQPISRPSYPLKQNYWATGLTSGIRYRF